METKNREKILLVLTGACLALMIVNWLVISPLIASWHRRADHITELRNMIADEKMTLGRENTIRQRWDHMSTNSLSNTPTVAERQLFDAFDNWVRASGV